jgi:hypothetical protein
MTDYVKIADYAAKDALAHGELAKIIRGTELGAEFDAIAIAVATKHDAADIGVNVQAYDAQTIVFATGTAMLFYQNTAPTGWTKVTTSALDNCALRIVSDGSATGGNGGVTGGTATFNAVFGNSKSTGSYTLQAADVPAHSHSVTDTGHAHSLGTNAATGVRNDLNQVNVASYNTGTTASTTTGITLGSHGGGGGHAHTINFDVRYASFIVATKN